jgi:acetolactate synthase regulatory subunit
LANNARAITASFVASVVEQRRFRIVSVMNEEQKQAEAIKVKENRKGKREVDFEYGSRQ